ncbi:hypothetical protein GGX14DRAFT_402447 [Mycena pura]|uniref:Uncharacterized protein n=1 Tax=Mycena pura TaxID=153505 RepID=A0AAD6Y2E8_9AGAR|nr:hypothetical protein GGX14DRAFT_402447 [Mycena pura]
MFLRHRRRAGGGVGRQWGCGHAGRGHSRGCRRRARAGVPCDANAAQGRGSDGGGGVDTGGCSVRRNTAHGGRTAVGGVDTPSVGGGVGIRARGHGHLAWTGIPCDADAVWGRGSDGGGGVDNAGCGCGRGRSRARAWTPGTDGHSVRRRRHVGAGVRRRWRRGHGRVFRATKRRARGRGSDGGGGAWTRRVWVWAWAFAGAGVDTWHGRAFRATQTPCGGGGVSGMRHDKGDRGQGARTWRLSTGSSTTQRQNAPKDGGSHVRDAGWWRRASQAVTAPGIDNEAP